MMFQIISIIILVLIAVGQFIVNWHSDSEKLGRLKYILLSIFLLSVGLTVYSSAMQYDEKQQTEKDNKTLLNEVKKLKGQHNDLYEGNLVLSKNYNMLNAGQDTILAEIRTVNSGATTSIMIPASETQLVELSDRRKITTDKETGLHQAIFVFRSRNVVPLRDIRIKMTFEKPIIRSEGRISGAFVTEQGTKQSLDTPKQYRYSTDYLSQSNDIVISITSKDSIKILNLELSP